MNGGDGAHTFAVMAFDADDRVQFEHTYDLAAGAGDGNRTIDGTPNRVEATVDGGQPVVVPGEPQDYSNTAIDHPNGCPDVSTTSPPLVRDGDGRQARARLRL